ncbi:hypothetical protein CERSUDRAFT_116979 [Gelatoporia subvermispora B]|uniref:ATP-dependent RNA helicase n=1 Tax=Ceriporiopsis subvermispora (strain B) TaxID=914234 RepID=M2QCQ0_CERS8|nr:hypothetical protein CERSUDRAFT_116979 [Gelatoporia subvermispora B]
MALSFWAKAARTSPLAVGGLFRATRCARVPRYVSLSAPSRITSARAYSSTATAVEEKPEEEPEDQLEEKPEVAEENVADSVVEGSPFSSLSKIVSYETIKAITVRPMKLTNMTSVQSAVLPLMPQLTAPYNPEPEDGSKPLARDLLVKARTGTGKTLAFLVPVIEARLKAIKEHGKQAVKDAGLVTDKHLESRAQRIFAKTEVGALIISPTRELATQIANDAIRLTHHHDGFEVRLLVGGNSKGKQVRDWVKGRRDIVVATPGRLRDMLQTEPEIKAGIAKTKTLILDEADTLLEMGFRDDIDAIKSYLPPTPVRQTFLFSATVSRAIQQVARATLDKNHLFINCVSDDAPPTHAHIPQYHTVLPNASSQMPYILNLLAHDQLTNPGASKVIVFMPTTKMTQLYSTLLMQLKSTLPAGNQTMVYEMHSNKAQHQRDTTSERFRNDKSGACVLVSSDVSARGVDYPGVTRVIQIGIPANSDQYVHRVGRTGRGASKSGRADLVLLPWEIGFVTWQLTDMPLKPLTVKELYGQVNELVEKLDSDPKSFFKGVAFPNPYDKLGRERVVPQAFPTPYKPKYEGIPDAIKLLLNRIDEEAVKETFASALGFYFGRSPELRVQRSIILQGLRDWSVEAMGLPEPPYVSEQYLQRLGLNDGRTKRFGTNVRREDPRPQRSGSSPWMGRGNQRLRMEREAQGPTRSHDEEYTPDPRDPSTPPDMYRQRKNFSEDYQRRPREDFGERRNNEFGYRKPPGQFQPRGNAFGVRRDRDQGQGSQRWGDDRRRGRQDSEEGDF